MANRGAQIKQEDLFSNDALDFAKKYKANVLEMIDVNEKLVESAKKYAELSKNFSKIDNQKQMIANKQAEALENQKAINLIKQMEAAEISLAKIEKQNGINRSKAFTLNTKEIEATISQGAKIEANIIKKKKLEDDYAKSKIKNLQEITTAETKADAAAQVAVANISSAKKREAAESIRLDSESRKQSALFNISEKKEKQEIIALSEKERKAKVNQELDELKLNKAKKSSIVLTTEEKVRQQELNREKTLSAKANGALISAYESLNAKRTVAKNTLRDLIANEKSSVVEIKKAQKEYDTLDKKVKKADKAVGDFSKNVGNYKSAFGSLTGFASNLMGAFGVVGGLTLFANLVKDIYTTTRELQSLDLALQQVTGTTEKYTRAQEFLARVSETYGVGINQLTRSYTQFYVSANDKLSGQQIEGIFESISKAAGFMGLTVDQQQGAFLALTQMLSKGTVQAEELRGQLSERLPGSFGILARSMGVTEQQLNKLLKDGKVLAAEVLPAFAKELEKAYGIDQKNRVESLAASQTRLSNAWINFVRVLNESETGGVSKFFRSLIDGATEAITLLGKLNSGKGFNDTFKESKESGSKAVVKNIEDLRRIRLQSIEDERKALLSKGKTEAEVLEITKKRELELEEEIISISKEKQKYALKERDNLQWTVNSLMDQEKTEYALVKALEDKKEAGEQLSFSETRRFIKLKEQLKDTQKELAKVGALYGFQDGVVKGTKNILNPEQTAAPKIDEDNSKKEAAYKKYLDARIKAMRDFYEAQKKLEDDAYKLSQFRFQREIDGYKDLVENEKTGLSDRLDFNDKANETLEQKNRETLEKQLRDLGVYNEKRGFFIRELSDKEIENIVAGGEKIKSLTSEQTLIYEQYQALLTDATKAGAEKRNQIIDSEYASNKKYIEELLQEFQNTANDDTTAENNRYKDELDAAKGNFDLIEQARENHEKRIIDIQRKYLSESLGFQIKAIEDIIYLDSQRPENERLSNEIIKGYIADLARFRKEQSGLSVDVEAEGLTKYREAYIEHVDKIKELSRELTDALVGLTNAIFENRINKIDEDIAENEEYYNHQLELAGNDQAQKDLINQEAEKKRKKLEEEKRKEQQKQAIFNKAMQASQVVISTIAAVMSALRDVPKFDFGVSAGIIAAGYAAVGAAQLATILATPIPKYKGGRTDGKAEWAEVGDGYVREVVENPDGSTYITPDRPTLTYLQENAKVHSSVEVYKKSQMDQYKTKTNAQSLPNKKDYSKDLLEEMKLSRLENRKNKGNVIVNLHGYSEDHLAWKYRNRTWK